MNNMKIVEARFVVVVENEDGSHQIMNVDLTKAAEWEFKTPRGFTRNRPASGLRDEYGLTIEATGFNKEDAPAWRDYDGEFSAARRRAAKLAAVQLGDLTA